jgi:hypothetical protein
LASRRAFPRTPNTRHPASLGCPRVFRVLFGVKGTVLHLGTDVEEVAPPAAIGHIRRFSSLRAAGCSRVLRGDRHGADEAGIHRGRMERTVVAKRAGRHEGEAERPPADPPPP